MQCLTNIIGAVHAIDCESLRLDREVRGDVTPNQSDVDLGAPLYRAMREITTEARLQVHRITDLADLIAPKLGEIRDRLQTLGRTVHSGKKSVVLNTGSDLILAQLEFCCCRHAENNEG